MKHRKFVKQLMSLGLDRNGAEDCARATRERHRESYAAGLHRFLTVLAAVENTMNSWTRTVEFTGTLESVEAGPVIITTRSPLLPDCLPREIMEAVRQKTPAELAEELPAPGLWPKINPSLGGGGNE